MINNDQLYASDEGQIIPFDIDSLTKNAKREYEDYKHVGREFEYERLYGDETPFYVNRMAYVEWDGTMTIGEVLNVAQNLGADDFDENLYGGYVELIHKDKLIKANFTAVQVPFCLKDRSRTFPWNNCRIYRLIDRRKYANTSLQKIWNEKGSSKDNRYAPE